MCGLPHSIRVTAPVSVTGLLTSNSAANEWWAATGAAAATARTAPRTSWLVFMRTFYTRARRRATKSAGGKAAILRARIYGAFHHLAWPRDVSAAVTRRQETAVRPLGDRQSVVARVGEEARRARFDPDHPRPQRSHRGRGGDRPQQRRADRRAVRDRAVAGRERAAARHRHEPGRPAARPRPVDHHGPGGAQQLGRGGRQGPLPRRRHRLRG